MMTMMERVWDGEMELTDEPTSLAVHHGGGDFNFYANSLSFDQLVTLEAKVKKAESGNCQRTKNYHKTKQKGV